MPARSSQAWTAPSLPEERRAWEELPATLGTDLSVVMAEA